MQAGQTLQAVVFDYKAVFLTGRHTALPGIADLLRWLETNEVNWVLLTNDPFDANHACDAAGLPRPALHLDRAQIPGGKNRGSGVWLETVSAHLDVPLNALLMIGTTEWDWRTGINAGVMYVHARWADSISSGSKVTAYGADVPDDIREFIEDHLLEQPSWAFGIDNPARSFRLRSLLLPDAQFPRNSGATFKLQNIFTYGQTIKIGSADAREVLMLHLLASAYLDGDLGRAWFCVYPSSTPGKVSEQIGGFLTEAKVLVGSYYKGDLLERARPGRDTSLVRYNGGQVTIADQAQTVRINPAYKDKLNGKTIIVFDDFTTAGMSLEWARNLLLRAGAGKVIALTVGKYRQPYTFYDLRPGISLDPYNVTHLAAEDFTMASDMPGWDDGPLTHLQKVFERLVTEA